MKSNFIVASHVIIPGLRLGLMVCLFKYFDGLRAVLKAVLIVLIWVGVISPKALGHQIFIWDINIGIVGIALPQWKIVYDDLPVA